MTKPPPTGSEAREGDRAVDVGGDVGGARAEIDGDSAFEDFFAAQRVLRADDGLGRSELDIDAGGRDALHGVLHRPARGGHEVHLDIEPLPVHPARIGDAVLPIDDVEAGNGVQHGARGIKRDRAPRIDHPLHIVVADLYLQIGDRDDAAVVERFEVRPGDPDGGGENLAPGGAFGLLHRGADRARRVGDVIDLAAVDAGRGRDADAENLQRAVLVGFADDCRDPAAAEVDRGDRLLTGHSLLSL